MLQIQQTYLPPPAWTYWLLFAFMGSMVLFNMLIFVALWRVGTILRRILFRLERPVLGPHALSRYTEAMTEAPDAKEN